MSIINVAIMKIIGERQMQENNKRKTKTETEKSNGNTSYSERIRAKLFCCAFKLGFFQLVCKASLILSQI